MSDVVDHPDHYNKTERLDDDGTSPFEVIKLIEDWGLGFSLGNALKYILRSPYKGRSTEDLRKAVWYLKRAESRIHAIDDEKLDVSSFGLSPKAACEAWNLGGYLTEVVCFIAEGKYGDALVILERLVSESEDDVKEAKEPPIGYGHRRRLPNERPSLTHHFTIGKVDGYVTAGLFSDGRPGEVFVYLGKQGTTVQCLIDAWAASVSIGLQHGVPVETIVKKFSWTQFEPQGLTTNEDIRIAKSPLDYIARWLARRFEIKVEAPPLDILE